MFPISQFAIACERLACTAARLCKGKNNPTSFPHVVSRHFIFWTYCLGNNTKYFLKYGRIRKKQHMKTDGRHFYFFLVFKNTWSDPKSVTQQKKVVALKTFQIPHDQRLTMKFKDFQRFLRPLRTMQKFIIFSPHLTRNALFYKYLNIRLLKCQF